MAIRRAVLLIADIGGYTRFMTVHRINLAHAQDVVAQLLEAIIDSARGFELAKLEGDAAFLYAPLAGESAEAGRLGAQIAEIRRAFLERQKALDIDRLCNCDGCVQVGDLKLKFVAHVGEVAEQRVKRNRELAGVSVITVHRMLKNRVPVSEYALVTDPLLAALGPEMQRVAQAQPEQLEGIGEVQTHYVNLAELPVAVAARAPSRWRKVRAWLGLCVRSLPYILGLKKPCEGFHNLEPALKPSAAAPAQ